MQDDTPTPAAAAAAPPALDAIEARILGCLIEKEALTPESYPLTENAIVAACNQKTSREPVMHVEPGTIAHALRAMEGRGLVRFAAASQRARRYEHRFDAAYGTTVRQRAVLCVMLLRGPQTLAELLARSDRLAGFPGLDDLRAPVDRLQQRDPALVACIGRSAGQREDRYAHLLCGPVDTAVSAPPPASGPRPEPREALHQRLDRLEADVQALRDELAALGRRLEPHRDA